MVVISGLLPIISCLTALGVVVISRLLPTFRTYGTGGGYEIPFATNILCLTALGVMVVISGLLPLFHA